MPRSKAPPTVDTSAGTRAHALAIRYQAEIDRRLPQGLLENLAADLTTLGAPPTSANAPPVSPAPPPPSLAEAISTAVTLITAVHAAIRGAEASSPVRKAYGVSKRLQAEEPRAVLAAGEKIVTAAQVNSTEALSLGILPADVTALAQALADLTAAEGLARGATGVSGKERRAAEARMLEAVARISGAGVLAFATNAAVRAEFAALAADKPRA